MSLSEVDRQLLQRCLDRAPRAWEDFVDRFLGLVIHVAKHSADARQIRMSDADRDDLVAEVFLAIVKNDLGVLRKFRRNCSLATYLTVISRRVIVRRLTKAKVLAASVDRAPPVASTNGSAAASEVLKRIEDSEEVERLMLRLDAKEANIVKMYHLEGRSYAEISEAVGINENSVGSVLSRARVKMRDGADA